MRLWFKYSVCSVVFLVTISTTAAEQASLLPPTDCVLAVRKARFAEASGDLSGAIALLLEAVENYPLEVLPLSELLRLHRSHEISAEEAEKFRSTMLNRMRAPEQPLAAGSIYFVINAHGNDREILGIMAEAIAGRLPTQKDLELLKALAAIQGRLGDYEKARRTLGRVIEAEASFSTISAALELDLRGEQWESALTLVDSVKDDPELAGLWKHLRVRLLAKTGHFEELDEAIRSLETDRESRELPSHGAFSLLAQVAWDLYDQAEMERSEAIWRTLLRANPDDLEARRVVANLFSNDQERLEQAEIVDQKLAEIDDPNELLNEGTNYLAAGDNERAFELLSRAATMHSGSEAVWFNLGLAADRLERWPTAIDAYREAYKLNQTRPETQLQLAAALVEIGDCAEAIPFFESGLVLDPEKTAAYYYLAGCYKVMGRAEDAAQAMAEYHRRSE